VNTVKDEYSLYGSLPQWAKIGNYFSKDNGAYVKIVDIVYVEDLNANVIVSSSSFAGDPNSTILRAQYNVFNWDAYEFDVPMAPYLNQEFQVQVDLSDPTFGTKSFLSEKIQVYSSLKHFMKIEATNSENNEVVYSTGIKHLAWLDYDIVGLEDETEIELHKTDDNIYQINGYSYEKKKATLTRLSSALARSIRGILTLDDITIDNLPASVEAIDAPKRIGVTNMYKLDVTFYEVGDKLTSGGVNTDPDLDILEVPGLISDNDEFIKQ
jgi:hypothetical protein